MKIASVGDESLALRGEVFLDFFASNFQHRTDDEIATRRHSRESAKTTSANQIQQQSFGIVVGVMCDANSLKTNRFQNFTKVLVAQFSCRHFDADFVLSGIVGSVEIDAMEGHVQPLAKRLAKLFVAVGFVATKMEIAVRRLDRKSQFLQHQQQANAVGTTRECHQIAFFALQQMVTLNEMADFRFKLPHFQAVHSRGWPRAGKSPDTSAGKPTHRWRHSVSVAR